MNSIEPFVAMLQDVYVNRSKGGEVVDMDRLLLPIPSTSGDCLRHRRIIFTLTLHERGRDENHMVRINEVAVG